MNKIKAELCIESYDAAILAEKLGFDSIEINSSLFLGGLTPSIGLIRRLSGLNIEKICMIRNRPAGFNYTKEEFDSMNYELDQIIMEDIDGVAFGFLTDDFEIDVEKTKIFTSKLYKHGKKAVFHRAIDNCKNFEDSIIKLVEIGVNRILTSGQSEIATDSTELLKNIIEKYSDRIEIVIGSGVNEDNVEQLISKTNANYVHSSCKKYFEDNTTNNNVSFSISNGLKNSYIGVDKNKAKIFLDKIRAIK